VKQGFSSGVFLPQVAPSRAGTRHMLSILCTEKRPTRRRLEDGRRAVVFTANVFSEEEFGMAPRARAKHNDLPQALPADGRGRWSGARGCQPTSRTALHRHAADGKPPLPHHRHPWPPRSRRPRPEGGCRGRGRRRGGRRAAGPGAGEAQPGRGRSSSSGALFRPSDVVAIKVNCLAGRRCRRTRSWSRPSLGAP